MQDLLTRSEYEDWLKSLPEGVCTFCAYTDFQVILKEFNHWVWVANIAPYWYWHTMIVSKRHFVEFDEMSFKELSEFGDVLTYTKNRFIQSGVKRMDNTLVEKFVYFWRFRINRYDPISGTIRPNHFHLHMAPDKDHLWDRVLDENAYMCNIVAKLGDQQNAKQGVSQSNNGTN